MWILIIDRIIQTICKHVVAEEALTGRYQRVRIYKLVNTGVVISALQVIELGLGIVDIAPVGEGIEGTEGVGKAAIYRQELAPGIVGIGDHGIAAAGLGDKTLSPSPYSFIIVPKQRTVPYLLSRDWVHKCSLYNHSQSIWELIFS